MISHKKIRECMAIFLAVLAFVGLAHKAGIHIPFVSKVVISLVQMILLPLSQWYDTRTEFMMYVKMFRGPVIWCFSSAWLGVAGWLWASRGHPTEGVLEIFVDYYFFMTALVSSSAFAAAYFLDPFFRIQFYSSSFALSLILSFVCGMAWTLVDGLTRKNR